MTSASAGLMFVGVELVYQCAGVAGEACRRSAAKFVRSQAQHMLQLMQQRCVKGMGRMCAMLCDVGVPPL